MTIAEEIIADLRELANELSGVPQPTTFHVMRLAMRTAQIAALLEKAGIGNEETHAPSSLPDSPI